MSLPNTLPKLYSEITQFPYRILTSAYSLLPIAYSLQPTAYSLLPGLTQLQSFR